MYQSSLASKRMIIALVAVAMIFLQTNSIFALSIIPEVQKPLVGYVLDVIDGEVIKVRMIADKRQTPEVKILHLSGVDTSSDDKAYEYTKDQLLGNTIYILYDSEAGEDENGFSYAYVFLEPSMSYNENMLKYGYGVLDRKTEKFEYLEDMKDAAQLAKSQEKGIYRTLSTPSDIININLAPEDVLMDHFDISDTLAKAIIAYREANAINSPREVGFIDEAFDVDFFEAYGSSIHCITDMNTASVYELTSLISTTKALKKANEINNYRVFKAFESVDEVNDLDLLTLLDYKTMLPYITIGMNNNVYIDEDKKCVNINTASLDEIETVLPNISDEILSDIKKFRKSTNYKFYSIEQLSKLNFPLNGKHTEYFTDDLTFKTDINTAGSYELNSLFSSFDLDSEAQDVLVDKIKAKRPFSNYEELEKIIGETLFSELKYFVVIEGAKPIVKAPINVNTSTPEKITDYLELSGRERKRALAWNKSMKFYSPLKVDYLSEENAYYITLYTNINKASYEELMNLSSKMTSTLANAIIKYRQERPIYNDSQLKVVLEENEALSIYNAVHAFIVYY